MLVKWDVIAHNRAMLSNVALPSKIERVECELDGIGAISIDVKRDDLIHRGVVGNKYRKSLPLLRDAMRQGSGAVASFGGANSNHLLALSYAGKELNLKTIGIVRGEELHIDSNETLTRCDANGMSLRFVPRDAYYPLQGNPEALASFLSDFTNVAIVPEGGTAPLALQGVATVIDEIPDLRRYDYIVSAVGTGGTALGLALGLERHNAPPQIRVLATSALKGYSDLPEQGKAAVLALGGPDLLTRLRSRLEFVTESGGRGFGKTTPSLLNFMSAWQAKTGIPLDYVYTGKSLHWIAYQRPELLKGGRLLFLHTGGYQTAALKPEFLRPSTPAGKVGSPKI